MVSGISQFYIPLNSIIFSCYQDPAITLRGWRYYYVIITHMFPADMLLICFIFCCDDLCSSNIEINWAEYLLSKDTSSRLSIKIQPKKTLSLNMLPFFYDLSTKYISLSAVELDNLAEGLWELATKFFGHAFPCKVLVPRVKTRTPWTRTFSPQLHISFFPALILTLSCSQTRIFFTSLSANFLYGCMHAFLFLWVCSPGLLLIPDLYRHRTDIAQDLVQHN